MIRDPIVEEVREIRRKLWEECHADFELYVARLKDIAAVPPERLVRLKKGPRRQRAAPRAQQTRQ